MVEQLRFLFQSDPQKFMGCVGTNNRDVRFQTLKDSPDDLAFCEIIRYGAVNDASMIPELRALYRDLVLGTFSETRRQQLFQHVKGFVDNTDFVSANALLPFIAEESMAHVVSTAVIDYVSLSPLSGNDPMSRPRDIVDMIQNRTIRNVGAAFGALLHLGDRRVCRLIWPLRDQLDDEEVKTAVNCTTGLLHAASVEFEIDWLEEMDADELDGRFGIVASGLARQKQHNQFDEVLTGERSFPLQKNPTPTQQARSRELARPVALEVYAKGIAPRLYALERTEPPPRVMPVVLSAWGLAPLSRPEEIASPDAAPSPVAPEIAEVRKEWFDGQGEVILTWGILNPNGPTLYCLGECELDGQRRLFFRWLHMFGGATYFAPPFEGDLSYQTIHDTAVIFSRHLASRGEPTLFNVIPSFVISNGGDETVKQIAKALIAADAPGAKDWGREVAYAEAFRHDFFGRAGCEIRATYEELKAKPESANSDFLKYTVARFGHLPAFKDAVIPVYRSSGFSPELFEKWWRIVGDDEHSKSALRHLVAMWSGALSMAAKEARNTVSMEQVGDFLARFRFQPPA